MNAAQLPIVEIEWMDASITIEEEASLDDPNHTFGGEKLCQDAGYLVSYDRENFVLAVSRFPLDNGVRHANTIPTAMIRSITYQESGKCLKKREILLMLRRKGSSATGTSKKTAPSGSTSGSESSSQSISASSTTKSPKESSQSSSNS